MLTEKDRHVETTYRHGISTTVRDSLRWDYLTYALQWSGLAVVVLWSYYRGNTRNTKRSS